MWEPDFKHEHFCCYTQDLISNEQPLLVSPNNMEVSSIMHKSLRYSSSNTNSFLEQLGKDLSHIAELYSATYPVQMQVI